MKIDSALRSQLKKRLLEEIKKPQAREVIIKTPHPLDEIELKKIKDMLPSLSQATLINTVEKSLVGGIVIIDGSMILDFSLKGKMDEVINSLLEI